MSNDRDTFLLDRLTDAANKDGSWGYHRQAPGHAEPTALSCLALSTMNVHGDLCAGGLAWLQKCQRADGGVSESLDGTSPCWPTPLAVLAWLQGRSPRRRVDAEPVAGAIRWLLRHKGIRIPLSPALFGHDTTLQGWAWVVGTHSWTEPTSYAILALRAAGMANHPRVREGVKLLLDRALPHGGWNYGNTRVLTHILRPFPATTGIVLAALAGEPRNAAIDRSITYLGASVPQARTPLTLGWALIGLTAWDARPVEASSWLDRCAKRLTPEGSSGRSNPLYDALLLLAGASWKPTSPVLDPVLEGAAHE